MLGAVSTCHLPQQQQQRLATKPHPAAAKVVPRRRLLWRNFASEANHKSDRTSSAKGRARQRKALQDEHDDDDDDDYDGDADVAGGRPQKSIQNSKWQA